MPNPRGLMRTPLTHLLLVALLTSPAVSQQFRREVASIPFFTETGTIFSAFVGGFDVANSALADLDGDGDLDLFVGDLSGRIAFFRNRGTPTQPDLVLEQRHLFSEVFASDVTPTLADIDADGDYDLFFGEDEGVIHFFRNVGTAEAFEFVLETHTFAGIDVGNDSAPVFADLDGNGTLDLLVGENSGNINYFRNDGTPQAPQLVLATEFLGAIVVGFDSHPFPVDLDGDGDLDLFVGEDHGNVSFYENRGDPTNPVFVLVTDLFAARFRFDSAPLFGDLDGDGDFDFLVGDHAGHVHYYENLSQANRLFFEPRTKNLAGLDVGRFSTPEFADLTGDGLPELFLGNEDGVVHAYQHTGSAREPAFTLMSEQLAGIVIPAASSPALVDIDADGDRDLFIGKDDGTLSFYRNVGTPAEAEFRAESERFNSIDVGTFNAPCFADLDADGDFDLLIGNQDGTLHYYRNDGSPGNPAFALASTRFFEIDAGDFSTPALVDLDGDGDLDLFAGNALGTLHFYRNVGTAAAADYVLESVQFADIDVGDFSDPAWVDIERDGDPDLFVGNGSGGLYFFRNVRATAVAPRPSVPEAVFLWPSYPNPFNGATVIRFSLPRALRVRLSVHNVSGQKVRRLLDTAQPAGTHSVRWDGLDDHRQPVATGVYFYRLQAGERVLVRRTSLVR